MKYVRVFLSLEAIGFAAAAFVHAGLLGEGYRHREASIAEGVIAVVLTAGLAATLASPASSRAVGLAVQGFALLGTLVGIFTIAIGIGPQSWFDVVLHAGDVVLLVAGVIVVARRARSLSPHVS